MIVDCHTHIDFSTDEPGIEGHLAAADMVDACVVLPCPGQDRHLINQRASQYVNDHKKRMIGFAVVEPAHDQIDKAFLKELTEDFKLHGFVLYCSAYGFHPTHSSAMRFYASVQGLGLPLFFHSGDLDTGTNSNLAYAQPYLLDEVARTFPGLKIIIGSMGVPFVAQTLAVLARHKNVYADLTILPRNVWQTYNMVVGAHEQGVMGQLVFGSGYPSSNAKDCLETLLGFNTLLGGTNLPTVPRGSIRNVIERNSLELLSVEHSHIETSEELLPEEDTGENQET